MISDAVVTTSPANFAGAATIHARVLIGLARAGVPVTLVAASRPFLYDSLVSAGVVVREVQLRSDAYPRSDALAAVAISSALSDCAANEAARGRRVVLCGSFIFPYFQAVILARQLLARQRIAVRAVAIPTGSDIWQIGARVPAVTKELLSVANCDAVVTYSQRFAAEVDRLAARGTPTMVAPPPLDDHTFRPLSVGERSALRSSLGVPQDAFVILYCCNMRPIKRVDVAVALASAAAEAVDRHVVLCLVGPSTEHVQSAMRLPRSPRLAIIHTGLVTDTYQYHQVADVAVSTSMHDSFNVSLAESLCCGVPAVLAESNGILEILDGTDCFARLDYPPDALENLGRDVLDSPTLASFDACTSFLVVAATDAVASTARGLKGRHVIRAACSPTTALAKWAAVLCPNEALRISAQLSSGEK